MHRARDGRRLREVSAALAGKYRLERELGKGGMARVYLAEDLKHGRRVALKLLPRAGRDARRGSLPDRGQDDGRPAASPPSRRAAPHRHRSRSSEVVHSAVVGSITDVTSDTRLAGKPPCRACSRTMASFGARYTQ